VTRVEAATARAGGKAVGIRTAELKPCIQRQSDPTWTFARGRVPELRGWTIVLTDDDGTVGLGYGHALPMVSTHGEGAKAAFDFLLPRLIGRDPFGIAAIMEDIENALAFQPSVKAGIDMALHDLAARRLNVPLDVLFGGRLRQTIPQARIVPLNAPSEMAAAAKALVAEGYRMVKVKLSGDIELDAARVAAVRAAVGAGPLISLDANQTYSAKGFLRLFGRIERHDIALIEQPVPAADWNGLKQITRTLPAAIEADESAGSLADVTRLVHDRAVDVINLKITKLGGIRNTLAAAQICAAGGVGCRLGAAFGPALLQAFSAHVAAAFKHLEYPCELAEHLHLLDDPFTPLPVIRGAVTVPEGPGCGVSLAAPQS
jgi:L-alanine-DL-glutamate epimerase-like enolase superfamily enzyme